jgi:hypothetical protein
MSTRQPRRRVAQAFRPAHRRGGSPEGVRYTNALHAFSITILVLGGVLARPTVAAQYGVQHTGEVVHLEDTATGTTVSILPTVGNIAFELKVKGQNVLRWPFASVDDFKAKPSMSGIPFLGPWANRLDEQAFYANGKRYAFDMDLGNVRGAIPIHGFLTTNNKWKVVEEKSDGGASWVTSRLEFFREPAWIKQWPFAHTIDMTYRLQGGVLEVQTRITNVSAELRRLPSLLPTHRFTPRRLDHLGGCAHALAACRKQGSDRRDRADRAALPAAARDDAARLRSRRRLQRSRSRRTGARDDVRRRPVAASRYRARSELQIGGRLVAEGQRVHLHRADGRHHRRAEPGAEGPLQGAADHPARRRVAGELLDRASGLLSAARVASLRPQASSHKPEATSPKPQASPSAPLWLEAEACGLRLAA